MPGFGQFLTAMREQMSATLSRSDVLKPLAWLVGLLLTTSVGLAFAKADPLIQYGSFGLTTCSVFLYCYSYVLCLHKNPDALRSEKYSINKMAIEHGLLGDSLTGVFEASEIQGSTKDVSGKPSQIEHLK